MIERDFDPGPVAEPFASLAERYPGADAYPPKDFRIEWGPVFHRGRLDGTARVLVLGQDPGQHESVVHRILVGEAGQRVQGFLRKLGIEQSYVMVNAFLYSVYGQGGGTRNKGNRGIVRYRHRWLDALLDGTRVEAVVAFGDLAEDAFGRWRRTAAGRRAELAYEPLPHPTSPEGGSRRHPERKPELMRKMLEAWNEALARLHPLGLGEAPGPLELYGTDLLPSDRAPIPPGDLPVGAPPWWTSLQTWARRVADPKAKAGPEETESKRARLVIEVPNAERPWH
jgi:uracil-DNA glycosylase